MQTHKIFIDGSVGTTGLRIQQRLAESADIQLLELPEAERKNLDARLAMVENADLTFLCLPDEAAREIAALAPPTARICDASTAHRTHPDWVYGLAEIHGQRAKIAHANRVANPGCHATGFLVLTAPLVRAGVLAADYPLACHSLTGYSGGGKAMIADYENAQRPDEFNAPRVYGLGMHHKHLPEMQAIAQLAAPPLFNPIVGDFHSGMLVSVPIPKAAFAPAYQSQAAIFQFFCDYYANQPLIQVSNLAPESGMLSANALAGKDNLRLFVLGNEAQILLCAQFDNLGKGASGAAIQCMNIMLGREETAGLNL